MGVYFPYKINTLYLGYLYLLSYLMTLWLVPLRWTPRFSTEIGAFVVEKRPVPRRGKYAVLNCLLIKSLCKLLFVLNFQLLKPAILFLFWDFYCWITYIYVWAEDDFDSPLLNRWRKNIQRTVIDRVYINNRLFQIIMRIGGWIFSSNLIRKELNSPQSFTESHGVIFICISIKL